MSDEDLRARVKDMLIGSLHLRIKVEEIDDEAPLFGDEGLGLDSVDAIELVSAIELEFGVRFASEDEARTVLVSVRRLAEHLGEQQSS